MTIRAVAILVLCATQFQSSAGRFFNLTHLSMENPADRLCDLIRSLYVTGENRVRQLLYQRSQYENTPQFEMGYVMGEIIERYRQLVMHLKNAIKFKNLKVFDKLMRLEFMQKLYFEIYHLVMMMNEIPRKYGKKGAELATGIEGAKNDNSTLAYAMEDLAEREIEKERERRQRLKELQNLTQYGEVWNLPGGKRHHSWPIEYGWSIEEW